MFIPADGVVKTLFTEGTAVGGDDAWSEAAVDAATEQAGTSDAFPDHSARISHRHAKERPLWADFLL